MEPKYRNKLYRFWPYAAVLLIGFLFGALIFGRNDRAEQEKGEQVADKNYWTCSMHPAVHMTEGGSCPVCGMDLVPAAGSGLSAGDNVFEMSEDAMALANISTLTVSPGGDESREIRLSGIITSNRITNSIQTTLFEGRLDKLSVNYVGAYVKSGEVIGEVYSPQMYAAQDQLLTSASYQNTHEKLFNAARNNMGLWKLTDEQIEQVLSSKVPMKSFPIYADVTGTVTEIMATEGDYYAQGAPLYKVSQLGTVWAIFDAYESQLSWLKRGQPIRMQAASLPGKHFTEKIDLIEPILDRKSRTTSIRVTLNNREGLLKPGMFVEGFVEADSGDGIFIPKTAVLWTGTRSIVYLKPDPARALFEMREITLGNPMGESYEVISGLAPGDEVVVNGTFTVDAAAQLAGKHSMMTESDSGFSGTEQKSENQEMPMLPDSGLGVNPLPLVEEYLQLKDLLVASDSQNATEKAAALADKAEEFSAHKGLSKQVTSQLNRIREVAAGMVQAENLEKQRELFKPLSEAVINLARMAPDREAALYVQYCPMADHNAGASWLSLEPEIRNPYFGSQMLTCGSVKERLE